MDLLSNHMRFGNGGTELTCAQARDIMALIQDPQAHPTAEQWSQFAGHILGCESCRKAFSGVAVRPKDANTPE